ncbi:TonB-dependent receptor [Sphingopyxis sp. BSN-002]|uniref:TonB-dependent receptor n=1 Tax=Sphingopyxis sp. BSN-002 TaxID=2911495 RepID=UPI001EDA1BAB|nr:TonB-dependent receptor [Sphingopyxis sp. BSN-002]UKK85177.1 TonB-dependent receptor [Sphingopyxis sp. BSN-002]
MTTHARMLPAIYATVSLAALAIATPAFAQEAPAEDNSGGALREIVVTAQKRSESVQSIPIAVTALDEKALESATIDDIRDIAGRVPSLVVDSVGAGPSAAAISIRGISFEDIEKSFDPAVGVVVDGVFIGTNTGQLLDSFDLERLEVLRGPQGTLFGRNTIGGVINVTRTKPTEDFGVRGQFAYSNFDTKRGRLVVNTGSLGGIIALKAFGYYDKTDGYYFNVTKNEREGRYETLTGGVTALITPSDAITAQVTYQHSRERGETIVAPLSETGRDVICAAPGAPGFSPAAQCNRSTQPHRGLYTTYSSIETPVRNDADSLTGNIDIELGDNLTLSSVTGYIKNKESVTQDFDASSVNFFETKRDQHYKQFSQELRLLADFDMVNLLVGGYYFNSSYTLDQSTNFGVVLGQGSTAVLRQYVDHHAKSYAGFADAQISLSDQFKVSLGARYTNDKKSIFNNYGRIGALVRLTLPTFDGTSCVAVTGTTSPAPGVVIPVYSAASNCSGSDSFGKFTWRANAEYTIEPGKLIYGSFSRGFRSGGFNGRAASPTSLGPYQPETVDAYEVGLKADWLDRTLRTNLAFYYTKYNNKQEEVVQPSPPGSSSPQETVVKNASSADIKGFEAEIIAQMSEEFSFNASFSYTDAKYKNFLNDIVGLTTGSAADGIPDDVSTLTLRRAPKYQWSAGLNYSKETGSGRIDASTLLRYQSKYVTCIAPNRPVVPGAVVNDNRCFTEDRENLSAQIGYTHFLGEGREVSLSLFGRNLTNHKGLSSTLPVAGLFTFGAAIQPRTYGVELGFRF